MTDPVAANMGATPESGSALSTKPGSLPRKHFFDDMPDKGLFGFAAVFGFVLIVASKLYNLLNSDALAGIAVAIMLCYGAIAYRIQAVQLRLDRLGDNFYYLGFVYTLASMSVALMQLRAGTNIDLLLGSFGIALFTTIVGVAGRVLFVQMRTEIDDLETTARKDLLFATNDLRSQLSLSLREFETFQHSVRQAATETLVKVEESVAGEVKSVGGAATLISGMVHDAFQANLTHAKGLTRNLEEITRAVEALTTRINAAELPTEKLEDQLDTFAGKLEQLLARVNAVVAQIEKGRRRRRWYWPFSRI